MGWHCHISMLWCDNRSVGVGTDVSWWCSSRCRHNSRHAGSVSGIIGCISLSCCCCCWCEVSGRQWSSCIICHWQWLCSITSLYIICRQQPGEWWRYRWSSDWCLHWQRLCASSSVVRHFAVSWRRVLEVSVAPTSLSMSKLHGEFCYSWILLYTVQWCDFVLEMLIKCLWNDAVLCASSFHRHLLMPHDVLLSDCLFLHVTYCHWFLSVLYAACGCCIKWQHGVLSTLLSNLNFAIYFNKVKTANCTGVFCIL